MLFSRHVSQHVGIRKRCLKTFQCTGLIFSMQVMDGIQFRGIASRHIKAYLTRVVFSWPKDMKIRVKDIYETDKDIRYRCKR